MKKIFFLFLLVISIKAFSQNDTTKYFTSNDYGWKYQRLKAVRAFILPYDTVINKLGLVALNGSVYLGDGIKWAVVGAGVVGAGTDSSIYATRFWVGANYYTKTQSDARYLQTIVGLNVSALNNDNRYWDSVRAKEWGNATFQPIGSYLTSYTETDPIYSASSWYGTTNNSGNWNTAYSKRLSSAGLTSSTLTLTLADASTVTASVPTFNQNTTGSAATLGTSRYIYGNLFNGSADITSTITDIYIESASNWNAAYTNRITTANSPLSISSNTLSITQAGTGTDGFLSSTDWNTFNGKQNALGYTAENNANKGVNNGYASLDGSGKIPTSQLPNLAMNNVWTVASQSAMLALSTAVVGDVAVRSDSSITYVLKSVDYTNPANWVKLLFPTAPVSSVNGLTGAVNLTTSNISEGSNMYYTDARARAAHSFSSGAAGYNSSTGVISIPTNNNQLTNGGGYISNITGLLTAGSNTSLSGSGTSGSPYVVNIPQSVATTAYPTFAGLTSGDLVIGSRATPFIYLSGTSMGTAQCIFINQNSLKIGWGADGYRSGIENASDGGGIAGVILRSYNGNIYLRDQNDATAKIVQGIWNGTAITDTYIASASTWNAKQTAIANGTGFLKNNGSGTWSYDNTTYLPVIAGSSHPLYGSLYFAQDGGSYITTKNTANNALAPFFFDASLYSFNEGDFFISKDNATFTLARANGNYGLRISQNNTDGSVSFNTKLNDNLTWQPYITVGEGNSSSTSHLFLQPTNGNTYIGSSAAFSVSPNGALSGTSASFSSSVTASSFIKSGGTSSQYLMADGSTSTIGTISSGIFTPSFSSASNCTVSAGSYSQYMRVGSTVTVSGSISINVSNTSPTSFYMTIPVESNFSSTGDGGIASGSIHKDTGSTSGSIQADTSGNNNKVLVQLIGGTADNHTYYYHYTYTIQ